MIIQVKSPVFWINKNNPTEIRYQQHISESEIANWKGMIVENYQFECPAPKENEILYQYNDNRGCYLELSNTKEATAVKLPPILKNEPATLAKRSTPDEIKF